jgi:hypothetical protein
MRYRQCTHQRGNPWVVRKSPEQKNDEITTVTPNYAQKSDENNTNTNQSSNLIDCFWGDNTPNPP